MRALVSILVLSLAACGGAEDFCQRLGGAPSCGETAEDTCYQAVAQQNASTPACRDELERLLECAVELDDVGCTGSSSAYANGDGQFAGPTNFAIIGSASLVVNDSTCDAFKRLYDDCAGNQ
jgi:hypothetical protein